MDHTPLDTLATQFALSTAERAELRASVRVPIYPWWVIPTSIIGLLYLVLGFSSIVALWSLPRGAPPALWPHPRGVSFFWQGVIWLVAGLLNFITYRRDHRRKALVEKLISAVESSSPRA